MKFDCESLISCLKSARLPEMVHTIAFDEETHQPEVVCMMVSECLGAIEYEIKRLKDYKASKEQYELLIDELKILIDKKLKLEAEIKEKEAALKEKHDKLADFLKTRGLDSVEALKSFFERYDSDKQIEMNKALDIYYRQGPWRD